VSPANNLEPEGRAPHGDRSMSASVLQARARSHGHDRSGSATGDWPLSPPEPLISATGLPSPDPGDNGRRTSLPVEWDGMRVNMGFLV
jgi:hypothetical protein